MAVLCQSNLESFIDESEDMVLLRLNLSSSGGKSFFVGEVAIGLRLATLALIMEARSLAGAAPPTPTSLIQGKEVVISL